ncbi:flagellar motor switch phosphatase FliY [Desulfosporosinus sp. BICA1-9]|uniref:flagellar motor switch phosphatase FliY n=1 Tax=Desulfosporosinus sp. BICA1-9 TaxID=1531958 RepID=UPI00054C59D1|nr:flagellar motor switch phosphatase FliY [Desulfosporosinus sp. BICA1-9]KJS47206.1 MAG: flagellar motor switch protein FliN [Peptococcaceae bacterium BRH_c23]KJS90021.1 MAG: flagellar motor switch protein FliN [Desulfosporosinus sp. BICA1-9]HBW36429.1 flagellar motor switch phosphatase FliY [Desulfosporosinus sp.]
MANGMLSQEEIDALLRGTLEPESEPEPETPPVQEFLDDLQKDTLGEIANISMGTAATTLSQLLGKKVDITTPKVDVTNSEQIREDYPIPSVICDVKYKAGIEGSNLLILSQQDGSVIVDLMMGGDGKNPSKELSELQISGISEAMNQMMGSAATSMSTMFNAMVDITPPNMVLNDFSSGRDILQDFLNPNEPLVRISFRMVVEEVIDSILIQVIPLSVAIGMVNKLMEAMSGGSKPTSAPTPALTPTPTPTPAPSSTSYSYQAPHSTPPPAYEMPPYSQVIDTPTYGMPQSNTQGRAQTLVQPAQFAPLQPGQPPTQPDNLNLILDVPLQISVELGRAKKTIKEILEMGPGSVIELDRLAGESVDMIVNGKLIAKCEVVVVNETFGIRITDIVHPMERMNSLK